MGYSANMLAFSVSGIPPCSNLDMMHCNLNSFFPRCHESWKLLRQTFKYSLLINVKSVISERSKLAHRTEIDHYDRRN